MRCILFALVVGCVPVATVHAATVDQLIEQMARRNRAQDEAERREEEAEERRRERAEAESAAVQRAPVRRAATPERVSNTAPRPQQTEATQRAPREAYRSGGRGSGGCGSRGGPGWRKANGQCASWRD